MFDSHTANFRSLKGGLVMQPETLAENHPGSISGETTKLPDFCFENDIINRCSAPGHQSRPNLLGRTLLRSELGQTRGVLLWVVASVYRKIPMAEWSEVQLSVAFSG